MNQSISSLSIISNNNPQFMQTDPPHTPDFDGVKTEEKIFCDTSTEFKITLGLGKTQLVWNDQATVSFDDFAEDLSESPVGSKDGPCYTPAIFSGNKRNKQEAVEIGIAALDADCGHTLNEIVEALEKAGLEAIVHSTYSHMTTESEISCSDFDKWKAATGRKAAPETSGKEAMAEASRSPAEQFVHDLLDDASAGDPPQPFNMLLQSFIGDTGPYQKPIDKRIEQGLSRALGRARVPHKRVRIEGEDEKKTVYAVADLDMWRVARDAEWAALKLQHPFF